LDCDVAVNTGWTARPPVMPSDRVFDVATVVIIYVTCRIDGPACGTSTSGGVLPSSASVAVVESHGRVRLVHTFVVTVTARHEFRANMWLATLRLGSWSYDDTAVSLRSSGRRRPELDSIDLDTDQYAAGDHWTLDATQGQGHEISH